MLPDLEVAFNQLKETGQVQGTFEEFAKRRADVLQKGKDDLYGYDRRVQMQHQKNITNEASRVGLNIDKYKQWGFDDVNVSYMGDKKLAQLTQEVQAAGGNTMHVLVEQSKRSADALERMERTMAGQQPAPAGVPPAIPMKPAAAGPAQRMP